MGKDNLKALCEQCSKLKQTKKLIFIADRDDEKIFGQRKQTLL